MFNDNKLAVANQSTSRIHHTPGGRGHYGLPGFSIDQETGGDGHDDHDDIHMPDPSYYPALASVGISILGFGFVYLPVGWIIVGIGGVITLWGLFGWSLEPVTREDH